MPSTGSCASLESSTGLCSLSVGAWKVVGTQTNYSKMHVSVASKSICLMFGSALLITFLNPPPPQDCYFRVLALCSFNTAESRNFWLPEQAFTNTMWCFSVGLLFGFFFFVWVLSGFGFCLFWGGAHIGYYIIIKKKGERGSLGHRQVKNIFLQHHSMSYSDCGTSPFHLKHSRTSPGVPGRRKLLVLTEVIAC